jgi:serine/threonine protein kinase
MAMAINESDVQKTRVWEHSPSEVSYDCLKVLERIKARGGFDHEQLQIITEELCLLKRRNIEPLLANELLPGDRVGHFVLHKLLARGGSGAVYRGRDSRNGEEIAIKILENVRMSDAFQHEMGLVQQLAHINIVTAYEVGEVHSVPYIAMELLPGPDLHVLVRDQGALDWRTSSQYILQVACALAHAHDRDVMHRDIKPSNIMKTGHGDVKLVDLGLAAMIHERAETDQQRVTDDARVAGTVLFMSPEQAASSAQKESDIYSLGATWFYLLTGKPRLPGETVSELFANLLIHRHFNALPKDSLPPALRNIFERTIAYDASGRYPNCHDLVADLKQAISDCGEAVTDDSINVLVIEDSPVDRLRTIATLRRMNKSLSIHESKTLTEGINTCCRTKVDLVLLDLNLPDSCGVETVQKLLDAAREVPIVVLTGTSDESVRKACLQLGVKSFITKIELTPHRIEQIIFTTLTRSNPGVAANSVNGRNGR